MTGNRDRSGVALALSLGIAIQNFPEGAESYHAALLLWCIEDTVHLETAYYLVIS